MPGQDLDQRERIRVLRRWTFATVLAWYTSQVVGFALLLVSHELITAAFPFPSTVEEILMAVLIFVAVPGMTGGMIAVAQWRAMPIAYLRRRQWAAANAIAAVLALGLFGIGMNLFPPVFSGFIVLSTNTMGSSERAFLAQTWFWSVLGIGSLGGLGMALPQWAVLRHSIRNPLRWILVGAFAGAAMAFTHLALVLILGLNLFSLATSCCLGGPVVLGLITGAGLFWLLKTPQRNPTE